MTKIQFAVDRNPTTKGYGVITFEHEEKPMTGAGISPVGPQDFESEQQAANVFRRAIGNMMASARNG
jgi:hypothetical protein